MVRKSPLMRVEHGGAYAVVASMGGAPKHPLWYGNLIANPDVTLQDGPNVYEMRAQEVTGDEKTTWWARAVEVWPAYNDYQARTERVIPLLVLERASARSTQYLDEIGARLALDTLVAVCVHVRPADMEFAKPGFTVTEPRI
jgi:deazaflavin-dependent oxidoreductase (nitroreductase family)